MSLGALLVAARDYLRTSNGLGTGWSAETGNEFTDAEIEVMPDARPPPRMGKKFVALYGIQWEPDHTDQNQGIDERLGIACALTFRNGHIPVDARGPELYVNAAVNMSDICRRIMVAIHQNIAVSITNTDALLSGTDKMVEYLRWAGTDPNPSPRDAMWFMTESGEDSFDRFNEFQESGYVMEVRFRDARRMQSLAHME